MLSLELIRQNPDLVKAGIATKNEGPEMVDQILEVDREKTVDAQLHALLLCIPNLPQASVPVGKSDKENTVVFTWHEKPTFTFVPVSYTHLRAHETDSYLV